MNHDRRTWIKSLAASSLYGLAGQLPLRAQAQQPTIWRAYTYNTITTATATRAVIRMIESIKEKSNGRLTIDLHLAGSLPINPTNTTAAISDNVINIADDAFFTGNVPIGNILRMPFLFSDIEDYEKAQATVFPYMESAFAAKGIVLLAQYTYAPPTFYSRKMLKSISDLKSQRVRTVSSDQANLVKRLGAIPITMGTSSVAAALDRGVIDGAATSSVTVANIWRGLFRYMLDLAPWFANSALIVNKAAFTMLPPDLQAIVRIAAQEACAWATPALQAEEKEAVQRMVNDDHLVVTSLPMEATAQLRAEMPAYWEQWAKEVGPDAVEALAKVRNAIGH